MGMLFSVGVGGGLGALARYYIAGWVQPAGATFNWGIFIVNISGGLLMGLIVEASALKLNLSPELRSFRRHPGRLHHLLHLLTGQRIALAKRPVRFGCRLYDWFGCPVHCGIVRRAVDRARLLCLSFAP